MSIRVRAIIVLVLATTLPLVATGLWSLYTLHQASTLAIEKSETALTEAGEGAILQSANAVAREVDLYLDLQPEVDLNDTGALQADAVLEEIAVQPVGQTGYTAVFDQDGIVHFHTNPDLIGVNMRTLADQLPEFWAIYSAALDGSPADGYYDWEDADGMIRPKYMSIVPVGDTELRVAATTYIDEFSHAIIETKSDLTNAQNGARTQLLLALVAIGLIAVVSASQLSRQLTEPIRQIADAATRFAAGDLTPLKIKPRRDEIGALAEAFNSMVARLKSLITRLEQRNQEISQHIAELQESNRENQRRTRQLEASAQVSRAATSLLDPDELLDQVVHLISDHFGYYHAGVFLLDEAGQWAGLQAANSPGGQRMLARGHRLAVGAQGIVGYVTHTGQPRVAHDVGADAIHFDNPDLPDTRSEIALPLVARDQIIGALDVQSTEENAFDEQDVTLLSALADQIAVALDNARLFRASQAALAQVKAVQRRYVDEMWSEYAAQRKQDFFEYRTRELEGEEAPLDQEALEKVDSLTDVQDDGGAATVVAPIKVRGQIIGSLGLQDAVTGGGRAWTDDEMALVETVADQVAQAMEAANLFDQTRRRAQQEQLVTDIISKIRAAPDIDNILRTTVQEIRRVLGVSHGVIRLGTETHLRPSGSNDGKDKAPGASEGGSKDE